MTKTELARARHRLYGLLGRLLAEGLSDEVRDAVQALPALAPLLADSAVAANHHRWLAYELSAHESAFVDGTLNGAATARVRATYEAIGFRPGRRDLEPDHIGLELAAMAHVCAMEVELREDGQALATLLGLQQRMVQHLQAWLPLLVGSVEGSWAAPLQLALELVRSHEVNEPPEPAMPEKVNAAALLVPCDVGWACTWTALRAAALEADCPIGFGSKRRALALLLEAPAGREALALRVAVASPRGAVVAKLVREVVGA